MRQIIKRVNKENVNAIIFIVVPDATLLYNTISTVTQYLLYIFYRFFFFFLVK